MRENTERTQSVSPQSTDLYLNFYGAWELFWPRDVTWGELHGAANDV